MDETLAARPERCLGESERDASFLAQRGSLVPVCGRTLASAAPTCYYYVMRSIGERSTDPGLLVLTSLAEGPKHGYAITLDVERLSGVRLGPGTLYGALSRLEGKGLIEALPAEDRRRPYRLTSAGSAALTEQLQTLQRVARSGLDRLRVAEATQ